MSPTPKDPPGDLENEELPVALETGGEGRVVKTVLAEDADSGNRAQDADRNLIRELHEVAEDEARAIREHEADKVGLRPTRVADEVRVRSRSAL